MPETSKAAVVGWVVAGIVVGGVIWFDPVTRYVKPMAKAGSVPDPVVVVDAPPADAPPVDAPPVDAPPVAEREIDADVVDAEADLALYTVTDAFDDIASGPLTLVGSGMWPGLFSIPSCVYRNDRVVVVNVYCTYKEQPAFSVIVISPTRGRLSLYAESDSSPSSGPRSDYFDFKIEVDPPDPARAPALTMSFDELVAWDAARDISAACYTGDGQSGCLRGHAPTSWFASSDAFLASPPASWFTLAQSLHARVKRDRK